MVTIKLVIKSLLQKVKKDYGYPLYGNFNVSG